VTRAVQPVLSFVIPVRNDAERLRRCLQSIAVTTTGLDSEVIVVDNGSTDASVDVAREAGARVLVLPDYRVAGLRNRGAREAASDLVAFVDADHELGTGWADGALDSFREGTVEAVGALCHPPPGGTWVQQMYDGLRSHEPGRHEVTWLGSGNLIVRKRTFERLGGFDESLETCEDVDLCGRIAESGGRLIADDRLHSVHFGDPPTLKALFLGEMWRGRDNLRVSLRFPLTLRSLPSVAIPILELLALLAIVAGLFTWRRGGPFLIAAGLITLSLFLFARAARLLLRARSRGRTLVLALQALLVAGVYDLARALALVTWAGHGTRRRR
jgi:GT2 family glycosyltransferase